MMPLRKRLTQDVHVTQIASRRCVLRAASWQAAEVQAAKTLRRKLLAEESPSLHKTLDTL